MFKIELLGIPFDAVSLDQAYGWAIERWSERRGYRIVTVNSSILTEARGRPEIAGYVRTADLIVCDGAPLVWLSRLAGQGLPERVAGIDLLDRLLARAAIGGQRVFFLGAQARVLTSAIQSLRRRHAGLNVVGEQDGYFPPGLQEEVVGRVERCGPDLLVTAMGVDREADFFRTLGRRIACGVVVGVGGALDVAAGERIRAPRIVQRCGMEWAFRMIQEPRRLAPRYARTTLALTRLLMRHQIREGRRSER